VTRVDVSNNFGVPDTSLQYALYALDTNQVGALQAILNTAERELARFRTSIADDSSMLEQVLQTAMGDATLM
jgi:hypothetical protein